jgi:hypothetical protein
MVYVDESIFSDKVVKSLNQEMPMSEIIALQQIAVLNKITFEKAKLEKTRYPQYQKDIILKSFTDLHERLERKKQECLKQESEKDDN